MVSNLLKARGLAVPLRKTYLSKRVNTVLAQPPLPLAAAWTPNGLEQILDGKLKGGERLCADDAKAVELVIRALRPHDCCVLLVRSLATWLASRCVRSGMRGEC